MLLRTGTVRGPAVAVSSAPSQAAGSKIFVFESCCRLRMNVDSAVTWPFPDLARSVQ